MMKSKAVYILLFFLVAGCRSMSGLFNGFGEALLTSSATSTPGPTIKTSSFESTESLQTTAPPSEIINLKDPIEFDKSYDLSNCLKLGSIEEPNYPEAKQEINSKAALEGANAIIFNTTLQTLIADIYRCENTKKIKISKKVTLLSQENDYEYHRNTDFRLFVGSYFTRQGVLRELGEIGPTFGLSLSFFSIHKSNQAHGWFLLWTFDHFWDTESKLLQPKFFDENYTNYMLGFGYTYRLIIKDWLQLHYKGGIAVNFIEIDTFGGGGYEKDQEYSDITLSTIHQLSIDFRIKEASSNTSEKRIGLSLLYYFCPDPLGKFSNDENELQTGGSLAWSIDFTFGFY